jgi:hypothetical protein
MTNDRLTESDLDRHEAERLRSHVPCIRFYT